MLRRILTLLGETPSSVAARRYAFRLADCARAEIAGLAGVDLPYIQAAMPGRAGATAYKARLEARLKQQTDEACKRLREAFQWECGAHRLQSEWISFEGDPVSAALSAAETRDLLITGHDTAFRGNVHEPLSDVVGKLLSTTPRPVIVCPDQTPGSTEILVAYDGSLPAMRAVQMFALLGIGRDQPIHVTSVDASQELAERRTGRVADFLRLHDYQVDEAPISSRAHSAETLKREIENQRIGTLVMGAYGQGGLRELLFGSTTRTLVKDPPCALFVYH
jgi:nucleotide-binding universal stress UspA family protein